jgi:signal transduction histidine kinase
MTTKNTIPTPTVPEPDTAPFRHFAEWRWDSPRHAPHGHERRAWMRGCAVLALAAEPPRMAPAQVLLTVADSQRPVERIAEKILPPDKLAIRAAAEFLQADESWQRLDAQVRPLFLQWHQEQAEAAEELQRANEERDKLEQEMEARRKALEEDSSVLKIKSRLSNLATAMKAAQDRLAQI